MSETKTLKQGTNQGELVGILSEKNLEIKLDSFVPNTNPKVDCHTIYGHIIVSTDNGDFRVDVYQNSKKKNGDDNKMYDPVLSLFTTYVSDVESKKNPELVADKVHVRFSAGINDYYSDTAKKLVSGVRFKFNGIKRAKEDAANDIQITLGGFITKMTPEVRNEEETGRKLVEFAYIGYENSIEPFNLVVSEEDDKEWFGMNFDTNDSCELTIEPKFVTIGKKSSGVTFGKSKEIADGYDVLELTVIAANPPIVDEDLEGYYDAKDIKKCYDTRKVLLEKIEKDGKSGKKSTTSRATTPAKVTKDQVMAEFADADDDIPF